MLTFLPSTKPPSSSPWTKAAGAPWNVRRDPLPRKPTVRRGPCARAAATHAVAPAATVMKSRRLGSPRQLPASGNPLEAILSPLARGEARARGTAPPWARARDFRLRSTHEAKEERQFEENNPFRCGAQQVPRSKICYALLMILGRDRDHETA
jgi:hypothetical protein